MILVQRMIKDATKMSGSSLVKLILGIKLKELQVTLANEQDHAKRQELQSLIENVSKQLSSIEGAED